MSEYQGRLEAICKHYGIGLSDSLFLREAVRALDEQDENTESSIVHGEWIDKDGSWFCSECDQENCYAFNDATGKQSDSFCPNCGARMKED